MHHEIFLRQLKRSKKTVLYLLLLIVAATFFVGSMNLYSNSVKNLKNAEDTYSTLVVTELYGDVDRYGELVEKNSEEHIGYKAVAVEGYDFSKILESEAVESWDLRTQYAAYVEGLPAVVVGKGTRKDDLLPRHVGQFLRFKIKSDRPVPFYLNSRNSMPIEAEVLEDYSGCYNYGDILDFNEYILNDEEMLRYAEEVKLINRNNDSGRIMLYPDVEYLVCTWGHSSWEWSDEQPGIMEISYMKQLDRPDYPSIRPGFAWNECSDFRLVYDGDKEEVEYTDGYQNGAPFPLQRWEDIQNNPELKAYYDKLLKDSYIQQYVHNVVLTNDITSIPAYHVGGSSLTDGRLITEEEYEKGANVAMVNKQFAEMHNLKIGDKLPLSLFESFYQPDLGSSIVSPIYDSAVHEFIHEGEYEIVGFYNQNPSTGNSGISANTLDMSVYNIYIPENSVPNRKPVEERMVHGSLFSIKIKNGSIDQFLNDMDSMGITTEKDGQFNPKFSFYDQGYSLIQSGLRSMNTTAKLLLALSSVLLLIVCVLLAYFFWQNQKSSVGIFRLLGGTKKNAVIAVLLCAVILCGIGAALGGAIGFGMAEVVGSSIIEENLAQSERDIALQAYVLGAGEQTDLAAAKADPLVTLASCVSVLIFPAVLIIFIAQDINKEPRELLPKNKT